MREKIEARLAELQNEFSQGQEILMRIQGAITILQEMLKEEEAPLEQSAVHG